MSFKPTRKSLAQHKVPTWYEDAKIGIFVHWSLFSVPAFAPQSNQNMMELTKTDYAKAMKLSPYAEWYLNSIRINDSPAADYHNEKYGKEFSYFDFQKEFEEKAASMDAENWAKLFKEFGAKYVVMVTKHHDGYLLWPSKHKNKQREGFQAKRDYVGEVCEAVKKYDMKMGLYYSGILDWSFKEFPMDSLMSMLKQYSVDDEYAEYATNHWYELIERYRPSVLWNDIAYPSQINLEELFAHFYNEVKDGVVNDRWNQFSLPDLYEESESLFELQKKLDREGFGPFLETNCHYDFKTPEYMSFFEIQEKKWESTRGIGRSFGYNCFETAADTMSGKELIYMLADVVSKNGNLLINVGPMADGTIPDIQTNPLKELGQWLEVNGEAIYGTRCWERPEGKTLAGQHIRFTKKEKRLYAILLSDHVEGEITILDLHLPQNAVIKMLGHKNQISWKNSGNDLVLYVNDGDRGQVASVFIIC